ncbi:MAG: tetratricopeptide repeat protein [Candidatus Obscuribacterales bacterium]|nr:tetratricopeptide repeat protein [Candidatus Obscuribacterales bacterium]
MKRFVMPLVIIAATSGCSGAFAGNSESLVEKGSQLIKQHEYRKAIPYLTQAIKENPNNAEAYACRADAQKRLDNPEKALEDANKAIYLDAKLAHAYLARGEAYYGLRKLSPIHKMIEDSNRAIELDPKSADAYSTRGFAFVRLGQYQKGLEDSNKAIELDPKSAHAYSTRGTSYNNLGQYQKAVEDYTKAIELDPKLHSAYCNRGAVYDRLNQPKKAIEDLTTAIELDPSCELAYSNRAWVYGSLGQHQKEIEDYGKAIELRPFQPWAYHKRGSAYSGIGQYQKALTDFTKSIELDPEHPQSYAKRYSVHAKLGHYRQALTDFRKSVQLDPREMGYTMLNAQLLIIFLCFICLFCLPGIAKTQDFNKFWKVVLYIGVPSGLYVGLGIGFLAALLQGIREGVIYGVGTGLSYGFFITLMSIALDELYKKKLKLSTRESALGVHQLQTLTINQSFDEAFQACLSAVKEMKNWRTTEQNKENGVICIAPGVLWWEKVMLVVSSVNTTHCKVLISSQPVIPACILDCGKNALNVRRMVDSIAKHAPIVNTEN